MPNYHYNVNVVSTDPELDLSLWIGLVTDFRHESDSRMLDSDAQLGQLAIARARELCPALNGCICEEWNGGEEVEPDPVRKFLGEDYEDKMAVLKAAIKPLLAALDATHMQLCVDHRCEYLLTAIPWRDELAGMLPEGIDRGKVLDATIGLCDDNLVAVID